MQTCRHAASAIRQIRSIGRLLGCLSDRMQNMQFGKAQVRRLRDQVADHIGGYRVSQIRALTTFRDRVALMSSGHLH